MVRDSGGMVGRYRTNASIKALVREVLNEGGGPDPGPDPTDFYGILKLLVGTRVEFGAMFMDSGAIQSVSQNGCYSVLQWDDLADRPVWMNHLEVNNGGIAINAKQDDVMFITATNFMKNPNPNQSPWYPGGGSLYGEIIPTGSSTRLTWNVYKEYRELDGTWLPMAPGTAVLRSDYLDQTRQNQLGGGAYGDAQGNPRMRAGYSTLDQPIRAVRAAEPQVFPPYMRIRYRWATYHNGATWVIEEPIVPDP